jgi:hypothetical protein
VLVLLCYSVGKIGFGKNISVPASVASTFALLLMIPPRILAEAGWWVSGSFNYLWPAALAAYGCILFFDRRERSALTRSSMIAASALAAYNEQVGFVLLCLLTPLLVYRLAERTCNRWEIAQVVLIAANWVIAVTAPGLAHRYQAEQAVWFANFESVGIFEKANIGLGLIKEGVVDTSNVLIAILTAIAAGAISVIPATRFTKIGLLSGLTFIGMNYILPISVPSDSSIMAFYAVKSIGGVNAASRMAYFAMALSLFAISCLVMAIARMFSRSRTESVFVLWAMLVGLASIAALGWSPTAYASGNRILFVCAIIFLTVTCRAVVLARAQFGETTFKCGAFAVVAIAALRTLQLAL